MNNMRDLHDAVVEGAVQRVRPKIMTVCAILFGLLPIMWSPVMQTGADVMKRIATPMIGGVISSAVLNLLIYPVIYVIWRRRELPEKVEEETAPFLPPQIVPSHENRKRLLRWITLVIAVIAIFFAGKFAWQKIRLAAPSGKPFITETVSDLTVNFLGSGGMRKGDNDIMIEFRDRNGQLVDVGNVKFDMEMNMPGMQMHSGEAIERTGAGGRYRAKIKIDMSGDWNTKISFDGPHGQGHQSFSLTVK